MSKKIKAIPRIKGKLEALHCPYLEDGSDQWLAELLLHPSEARIKLLSWLILQHDTKFEEILDSSLPVISSHTDSRHQKMLLALNIMGICKINDIEIVRGTASQKRQVIFWENILDFVHISVNGHLFLSESSLNDNDTSYYLKPARAPTLTENFNSCCKFVDTLVREHRPKELFSKEIHLFSPDIETSIKDSVGTPVVPDMEFLIETAENIQADLENCIESLKSLNDKIDCVEMDQPSIENYCRKFDLSMKMFSQIIDSYLHYHESEFEAWCKHAKPDLSAVGAQVKSVHEMMQPQTQLADSLASYNSVTSYLTEGLKDDIQAVAIPAKPHVINKLRDISEVLRSSLQRHEKYSR